MTEIEFARQYLGEFKIKGSEIIPKYCPFCNGGDHRDRETFALNMDKHTYNCRRGSCGRQGHFSELCRTKGERMDDRKTDLIGYVPKKKYKPSQTDVKSPTSRAAEYIRSRKITQETADAFGLGSDENGNVLFPFYRTEEDFKAKKPTFVKFRKPEKILKGDRKMWREADTEPILFGLHLCKPDRKILVITEGEFDCLAVYQATCGSVNVVSVPSGAEDFTWIETCGDELEKYREIMIFGDSDAAGQKMVTDINSKFSDKAVFAPDLSLYGTCKDANEVYFRGGGEAVQKVLSSMKPIPVAGLLNLADVRNIDLTQLERTMTGVEAIDKLTGGMLAGDLTVWTGKRGEGKSTFLNQFSLNAVDQGKRVCIYSGEVPAERMKYWMHLCAAGKRGIDSKIDTLSGREVFYVKPEFNPMIEDWYNYKLWVYDNKIIQLDERDSIIDLFTAAYCRYDCRMFIVDNLMTVNLGFGTKDIMQIQAEFVVRLRKFAERYGVHVHVVVHPRKVNGEVDDNDEVGGMAVITNIACNVFSVAKIDERHQAELGCNSKIKCMKNRAYGDTGDVRLTFTPSDRRFVEVGKMEKTYGWHTFTPEETHSEPPF